MKRAVYAVLIVPLLVVAAIAGVSIGSTHVEWPAILRVLGSKMFPSWISAGSVTEGDQVIIWLIRAPRVMVAGFVGAGLAISGTLMQGLFRNSLADPNIIGVASGAVFGAVIVFVSGLALKSILILPAAAFIGALTALATVYGLTTRGGVTPVSTLLLSGIALAALLGALSSLLLSLSIVNWQVAQEMVFWMMGGLDSRSWTHVWMSAPFIVVALCLAVYYGPDLDLLVQGEETAAALGLDVESSKRTIIAIAALITGSCVAVAGGVGFVGLIVPHVVRIFVGSGHRALLPMSALSGAFFLIVCDLLARTLHPPTEIRLGIITAAFGAPFFLYLLLRQQGEVRRP